MENHGSTITPIDPEERFILRNFELQRDERIEIESLRSLFRVAAEAIPFTDNVAALPNFIAVAKLRLNNLQIHEKLFFEHQESYKREPLVVSSLMASQLEYGMYGNDNPALVTLRRAFTQYLPEKAEEVREEVVTYVDSGIYDRKDMTREGVFCAHLEALETIDTMKKNFAFLRKEFFDNHLRHIFPAWESFIERETYLGQQLQREIVGMVKKIHQAFPAP